MFGPAYRRVLAAWLVVWLGAGLEDARAQDRDQNKEKAVKLGWSNSTDLSLVVTDGNSPTQTLGFADELRYEWTDARFELNVNGVRSHTSDDRFFLVEPGIDYPVGGTPPNPATSLIKPEPSLDVANHLIRGGYEKNITPRFFWNTGASWTVTRMPAS